MILSMSMMKFSSVLLILNILIELVALLQSGAQHYELADLCKASRNGYKPRTLLTKYEKLELLKPQLIEQIFSSIVYIVDKAR